ncbi:ribonuclease H-like domain-containing protein [Tanacetum coccineum]
MLGLKRLHGFLEVTVAQNGITVTKMSTPVTAEEKTNKKNDVKARDLKASKDSQYVLAILGVIIAQEDLNLKFLSSLPPEWNTHVVVWMNKPEVETISIDDLYNNFKIVEQKVKKTAGTSSGVQNLAFMTAPSSSSTNDANTASSQVSATSPKCYNCQKLGHFAMDARAPRSKEGFDGVTWHEEQVQTNMALMILVEAQLVTYRKNEVLFSEEFVVLKREVGVKQYEINMLKTEPNKLDLSYSGLDEVKEPKFKGYGPKNNKKESNVVCDKELENFKANYVKSLVEEQVSQVKSSFVEGCGSYTSKSVSEVEPKKVRKNNDALIIEDCGSQMIENKMSLRLSLKRKLLFLLLLK